VIKEFFTGVYEAGCRGEAYRDVFTAAPVKNSLVAAKARAKHNSAVLLPS
jgi:hypothetical protein